MIAVAVLISKYGEVTNHEQLLSWISGLRTYLRANAKDLFTNSLSWKLVISYIDTLEPSPSGYIEDAPVALFSEDEDDGLQVAIWSTARKRKLSARKEHPTNPKRSRLGSLSASESHASFAGSLGHDATPSSGSERVLFVTPTVVRKRRISQPSSDSVLGESCEEDETVGDATPTLASPLPGQTAESAVHPPAGDSGEAQGPPNIPSEGDRIEESADAAQNQPSIRNPATGPGAEDSPSSAIGPSKPTRRKLDPLSFMEKGEARLSTTPSPRIAITR
jgi:hypothetical protein